MKKARIRCRVSKSEKRKAQRINLPIQVSYSLHPKKKVLDETFCHDISGGGLCISFSVRMKKGDRLKTLLHFPNDKKPVTAISKVAWVKKGNMSGGRVFYNTGIKHVGISHEDRTRFVYLFCEMMINHLMSVGSKRPLKISR